MDDTAIAGGEETAYVSHLDRLDDAMLGANPARAQALAAERAEVAFNKRSAAANQ